MTASELRAQAEEGEPSGPADQPGRGEPPQGEGEVLAAAASLLDGFFDAAPVGLALLDRELRVIRVNDVLARLAGRPGLVPGGPLEVVLPALASPELLAAARRAVAAGETSPELAIAAGEEPGRPPEARRALVATCYALRGTAGILGVGLVVQDVTRRRQQQEFHERVLGIVGHDLRSPLAAVRISAQILGRAAPDPRHARLLGVIEGAARRMQRIIEDLLDYTAARVGGGIPIRPSSVDVAQVCREVVAEALAADPDRVARCEGEGDPVAELDPDRLGQALANVVGNAFRYGTPEHAIEVRWRGEPDAVVVEVSNRGPIIPPELVGHVFEPFRRGVHPGGEGGGLGLGLFIARHIVAAHGGELTLRSDAGETCFTVTLPRRRG
ncbi:sensor histidine kinase [Anaeromyxobacter diazotrophicus]|nr:PAS domain-containing sensor histidine kinase [Anaeromyxobacter diazotrophicus]